MSAVSSNEQEKVVLGGPMWQGLAEGVGLNELPQKRQYCLSPVYSFVHVLPFTPLSSSIC